MKPKLLKLIENAQRHKALFQCFCGKEFITHKYNVFNGHTKSCGCIQRSDVSKSRTYRAWQNMKTRCLNPNTPSYRLYGGRGINLYYEWLDYKPFLRDMGHCPPGSSLDRIDVNGNYTPENCRWATNEIQQNNRRNHHYVLGQTISHAARKAGLKPNTVVCRLRRGWTDSEALEPVSRKAA